MLCGSHSAGMRRLGLFMRAKIQKIFRIFRLLRVFFIILQSIMMLELHNVCIGDHIRQLSLTLENGQIMGMHGTGKTILLRAVAGLIPIDAGHICIDGEILTPESAPYFRRFMAYVPQHLSVPEGYQQIPTDYLSLLRRAVTSDKQLLLVDEPAAPLTGEQLQNLVQLLTDVVSQGRMVLTVTNPLNNHYLQLC
jgi:ABC-type cobalamin/Fe3+-siderophores transport system ATPase subunit